MPDYEPTHPPESIAGLTARIFVNLSHPSRPYFTGWMATHTVRSTLFSQTASPRSSCNTASPSASARRRTHAPDEHRSPRRRSPSCTVPKLVSLISRTFSFAIGSQKLGQPVPESNFVSELNSAVSQQTHRKIPFPCSSTVSPVNARSVPSCRVTSYWIGESSAFHSASVFTVRATVTFPVRLPSGENCTIVAGPVDSFASLASTVAIVGRRIHHAAPAAAAAAVNTNARRPVPVVSNWSFDFLFIPNPQFTLRLERL